MEDFIQVLFSKRLPYISPTNYGYHKVPPSSPAGPSVRDFWLLTYVISGKGEYRTTAMKYNVTPGQCFVIRPSEVSYYISDKDDPWTYVWIGFRSDIKLPQLLYNKYVFDASHLEDIFLSVLCVPDTEHKEEWLAGKVLELMSVIGENDIKPQTKISPAEFAKTQLEQRHADISIAALAEEMHFNRMYLATLFKKEYGTSMQSYLLSYRLNRAAKLIGQMGYSPTKASEVVGYKDFYCFSKLFKKHIGLSPTDYINSIHSNHSFHIDRSQGWKKNDGKIWLK